MGATDVSRTGCDVEPTVVHSSDGPVGLLHRAVPDMWYLEGDFVPANTTAANAFVEAAECLDPKVVYKDLTRGIPVELRSQDDTLESNAVVLSLSQGRLFVRRVFDRPAREQLKHVADSF